MVMFLAELNGPELFTGEIWNAYLETSTKETISFISGPCKLSWKVLLILRMN